MTARGIRNNNPGNIEYNEGTKWKGLAAPPSDGRFCIFRKPKYGIRALAMLIENYQDFHGIDTIEDLVNRWAPSHENDSEGYAEFVADRTGFGLNEVLDFQDYRDVEPVLKAIIRFENGEQPYSQSTIDEGMKMAGFVAPRRPGKEATKDIAVIGGIGGAAATVSDLSPAFPLVEKALEYAPWVVGVALVLAAAYIFFYRIKRA